MSIYKLYSLRRLPRSVVQCRISEETFAKHNIQYYYYLYSYIERGLKRPLRFHKSEFNKVGDSVEVINRRQEVYKSQWR